MAKRRKKLQPDAGPYLAVAALCEKVLQEKDGVISLIRMVDRTIVSAHSADAPEELPAVALNHTLFVALKSGFAKGKYTVTVQPYAPSGRPIGSPVQAPVLLEGDDRGVNLIVGIGLTVEEEGLYWIDIQVEGHSLTRVPLRVLYQRMTQSL
jgi:hypothetical protein